MNSTTKANVLALAVPGVLMAGAWGSQYLGGLYPCEMCYWQRWPHEAAIALAILAFFLPVQPRRVLVALAGIAVLISGLIGIFHAGVEYHWWPGLTTCSQIAGGSLADIMATPMIRCDAPQWTLGGISLAGFNAILSIAGALTIFAVLRRRG